MNRSQDRTSAPRSNPISRIPTFLDRLEQRFFAATAREDAGASTSVVDLPAVRLGLRVLVADDNPASLNEVAELLAAMGATMLSADDGAQAVALALAGDIDFVLMDLQMPVLDGLGATKQIRQHEGESNGARVPVVAYTSRACDRQLVRDCGLDAVLSKPCSEESLRMCLARWCDSDDAGQVEPKEPGHLTARHW